MCYCSFSILRRVSMKAFGLILVSGLLLFSFRVNAQSGAATQQNGSTTSAKTPLSQGEYVTATLSHTLDAAKAKAGDPVLAAVPSDYAGVLNNAKLIGHIGSVQRSTDNQQESRLVIVFDKARLKDGSEIPFNAVITTVLPPTPPEPRQLSTMEPGGLSAHDRAAGPVQGPYGVEPAAPHQPTVLEMQADRSHLASSRTVGFKDLYLKSDPSGSTLMSPKHNVKIGKGVILILRYIGSST
jgi:hypothetical protein